MVDTQDQIKRIWTEVQETSSAIATKSHEIEQGRIHAQSVRGEIDGQLSATKDAVSSLQQLVEPAKGLVTEITTLHLQAKTSFDQMGEWQTQGAERVQRQKELLNTVEEGAKRLEELKAVGEQSLNSIETARSRADNVRGEMDRFLTQSQQAATTTETHHQSARATVEGMNTLMAAAQTAKATAESNGDIVLKLKEKCEEYAAIAKNLADIAENTDKKLKEYEQRLAVLQTTADERLKTIEGLLPGAASAGLASAFNLRRGNFKWPQRIWQAVFVACVLALLGIATIEFSIFTKIDEHLTWERLSLSLLHRLPFAVPLIWLAFHASHKAALAQRLEEDYAFKETVSRSFEGYKHQMAELEGKEKPLSALSRLCAGVLGIITDPPGRIYERHPLNKTPWNAITETVGPDKPKPK